MIRRLLFKYDHLELMEVREHDRDMVLSLDNVRFVLKNLPANAGAMTMMRDGRILWCMGYWMPFPGVAEVWLIPSIYVEQYKLFFVREVKRYLETTAIVLNWHRVQTVFLTDFMHRKWFKVLGFVEEGLMKNYLGNQDYFLAARYFERGA